MDKLPALGLRTRIAIALAVIMALFILLTELSVSQLVRVAMSRHSVSVQAEESTEETDGALERDLIKLRRLVLFYMVFGAVVALLLGSWAITRLVVRPLSRITRAVEQVAEGKLETEVPIDGSGELIRLSVSFNKMTSTLRGQRTELKSHLEQLEKSTADLRATQDRLIRAAKLASVGTLAAGVAHEIGNPLSGVLGLLEALEHETEKETPGRYLKLMKKEIQRIDRIINDLLVYARPVRSNAPGSGTATVEEVLDHVRSLLKAQKLFDHVEISVDLKKSPGLVLISRDDLTQVMINLMLNAAQAMKGKGKIILSAEQISGTRTPLSEVSRDAVRIRIADTGPGVPKEYQDRIFDPFFSARSAERGTGLGLAICQSICDRGGGEITLEQERDTGSCFVVTLPVL